MTTNGYRSTVALPTTAMFVKNLFGAFLILFLALSAVRFLFLPEIIGLYDDARLSGDGLLWMIFIGSVLTASFVTVFPLFLVLVSLHNLGIARSLDRSSILTNASVLDKWVDDSDGKRIYCISYLYMQHLQAVQIVNRSIFERLYKGASIKAQVLERLPNISRLWLELK